MTLNDLRHRSKPYWRREIYMGDTQTRAFEGCCVKTTRRLPPFSLGNLGFPLPSVHVVLVSDCWWCAFWRQKPQADVHRMPSTFYRWLVLLAHHYRTCHYLSSASVNPKLLPKTKYCMYKSIFISFPESIWSGYTHNIHANLVSSVVSWPLFVNRLRYCTIIFLTRKKNCNLKHNLSVQQKASSHHKNYKIETGVA